MKKHDDNIITAILVDGGFYRKRAARCIGKLTAKERADEIEEYCKRHLYEKNGRRHQLYRIFYYDCPPIARNIYNPLTKQQVNLSHSDTYFWSLDLFNVLRKKRKFALRLGKLNESNVSFNINPESFKQLCNGSKSITDLSDKDILLNIDQKGVDMKIGVDIASLAYKHQVTQIVLISGDSDFVPAAKLARREGIDFILDPLGASVKPDLFEHIDGLRTCDLRFTKK